MKQLKRCLRPFLSSFPLPSPPFAHGHLFQVIEGLKKPVTGWPILLQNGIVIDTDDLDRIMSGRVGHKGLSMRCLFHPNAPPASLWPIV